MSEFIRKIGSLTFRSKNWQEMTLEEEFSRFVNWIRVKVFRLAPSSSE